MLFRQPEAVCFAPCPAFGRLLLSLQSLDLAEYNVLFVLSFTTPAFDSEAAPSFGTLLATVNVTLNMLGEVRAQAGDRLKELRQGSGCVEGAGCGERGAVPFSATAPPPTLWAIEKAGLSVGGGEPLEPRTEPTRASFASALCCNKALSFPKLDKKKEPFILGAGPAAQLEENKTLK